LLLQAAPSGRSLKPWVRFYELRQGVQGLLGEGLGHVLVSKRTIGATSSASRIICPAAPSIQSRPAQTSPLIGARLDGQRLELARELVPNVVVIAVITNPNSMDASEELRDVQNAAKATRQELVVVAATSDRDFASYRILISLQQAC
jgi:hypothetical protein